ncbi:hypothetical protein [Comamonas sp. E6]|uniref:hypothetical protein n=1 Tax=Comamonas sp. E6 TaxID=364029 RepID=UPI000A4E2E6F|nr:hypothetical protein [Comamonas sp. E6]
MNSLSQIPSISWLDSQGSEGVESDAHVGAALNWLASSSGDAAAFFDRLRAAQARYRAITAEASFLGKDPSWSDLGPDIVAAYLAQGKSLLDDRRTYDFALVSHVAPWLKQLGMNIEALKRVDGAVGRALRMLRNKEVLPDTAIFELVMASNYAAAGYDVTFIEEGSGKTPDLKLSGGESSVEVFVELKRLQRGSYEIEEQRRHVEIFSRLDVLLNKLGLSVDIDVTYEKVLSDVPVDYLLQRMNRALENQIILPNGYPWKDEYGRGIIRPANVDAVRHDIRNSYLYFGMKLARLLSGRAVSDNHYHLSAEASPSPKDPRYIDRIKYGSVVTWKCIAQASIERKAKYVMSKLAQADRQIEGHGRGVIHIAMDVELDSDASDLRRQRNSASLCSFQLESQTIIVHLHYFVPRQSENHSWLSDETVDTFSRLEEPQEPFRAFPCSTKLDNGLPAWRQKLRP